MTQAQTLLLVSPLLALLQEQHGQSVLDTNQRCALIPSLPMCPKVLAEIYNLFSVAVTSWVLLSSWCLESYLQKYQALWKISQFRQRRAGKPRAILLWISEGANSDQLLHPLRDLHLSRKHRGRKKQRKDGHLKMKCVQSAISIWSHPI